MAKINELFDLEKGTLQSSKCVSGDFDFITASREWKTHNEYTHDKEAIIFAAAASGSLGRTHYVNGKFITSDLCFVVTPKNEKKYPIDLSFYHIIFQILKDDIVKNTKAGTSKEAIGLKSLGNYDLPYIDIKKQKEISNSFKNNSEISDNLSHELTHQLSLISQLRQVFLREAMQGTLVSNETSDGKTGADLLEEIKKEKEQLIKDKKIKKGKPLPPISEGEIPFDIPENWVWCRLGEITINCDAARKPISSKERSNLQKVYDYYGASGVIDKIHDFTHEGTFLLIGEDGNNLISRSTPLAFIAKGKFWVNNHAHVLKYTDDTLLHFMKNWLNIFDIRTYLSGGFQPKFSQANMNLVKVPLPPLEIQNRMVAKLDELMQYCDALEASVKESQNYNAQLLQQVLREAVEGKN